MIIFKGTVPGSDLRILNMIMMHKTEYLGYLAGIITTLAFFPQALKIFRRRQTRDISLTWALAMNTGVVLWLLYGISINNLPMIAANSVTLALLLLILYSKLRFK